MHEKSTTTPPPPYDVIIFTGKIKRFNEEYLEKSAELYELIKQEEGFYGAEVLRNENQFVTVHYYWHDLDHIKIWDKINDFMNEKEDGVMKWFDHYKLRIGTIEREFQVEN